MEHSTPGALLLLPDVHILGNLEGSLHISSEEGVFTSGFISIVHYGHVLSVAIGVLGVDGILQLPGRSIGEFSKIPPVVEGTGKVGWNLSGLHDDSLEGVKLILGNTLVHLDEASGLELSEAELGDSLYNSGLGRRREDTLESAPCGVYDREERLESIESLGECVRLLNSELREIFQSGFQCSRLIEKLHESVECNEIKVVKELT